MSTTKSQPPLGAARSMTLSATAWIVSSMLRIIRGLKAWETMRRRRACRGSSVLIMPPKYSSISTGMSIMLTAPWPER